MRVKNKAGGVFNLYCETTNLDQIITVAAEEMQTFVGIEKNRTGKGNGFQSNKYGAL